ncbi:hypothetical protein QJQ45_015337 [Haematococcus lacustris]|nr:hypothetical protein QJQ45_015337 [Haematococcus lacustris]
MDAEGFTTVPARKAKAAVSYSTAARAGAGTSGGQGAAPRPVPGTAQRGARRPLEVAQPIVLAAPSAAIKELAALVVTPKDSLVLRAHHSPSDMAVLRRYGFTADACAVSAVSAANQLLPAGARLLERGHAPSPFVVRAADGTPVRGSVQVTLEGPAASIAAIKSAMLLDTGSLQCLTGSVPAWHRLQLCQGVGRQAVEFHLTSIRSSSSLAATEQATSMAMELMKQFGQESLHGLQVVWVGWYDAATCTIQHRVASAGNPLPPLVQLSLPTRATGLVALTCGGREAFSLPGRRTVPISVPELQLQLQLERVTDRLTLEQRVGMVEQWNMQQLAEEGGPAPEQDLQPPAPAPTTTTAPAPDPALAPVLAPDPAPALAPALATPMTHPLVPPPAPSPSAHHQDPTPAAAHPPPDPPLVAVVGATSCGVAAADAATHPTDNPLSGAANGGAPFVADTTASAVASPTLTPTAFGSPVSQEPHRGADATLPLRRREGLAAGEAHAAVYKPSNSYAFVGQDCDRCGQPESEHSPPLGLCPVPARTSGSSSYGGSCEGSDSDEGMGVGERTKREREVAGSPLSSDAEGATTAATTTAARQGIKQGNKGGKGKGKRRTPAGAKIPLAARAAHKLDPNQVLKADRDPNRHMFYVPDSQVREPRHVTLDGVHGPRRGEQPHPPTTSAAAATAHQQQHQPAAQPPLPPSFAPSAPPTETGLTATVSEEIEGAPRLSHPLEGVGTVAEVMVVCDSAASFAPGSHTPGLRLATHNIQGFANRASTAQGVWSQGCTITHRTKVHDLVYLWGKVLRLHVVCVQETKLSGASRADNHTGSAGVEARIQAAAHDLGIPGYTCFWASYPSGASKGVGVLVRSDLLRAGHITIRPDYVHPECDGRRLAVRLNCFGHDLTLLCLYMPCEGTGQTRYLKEEVCPWIQRHTRPGSHLVLLGDMNMVFQGARDCLPGWNRDSREHHILDPAQGTHTHRQSTIADYTTSAPHAMNTILNTHGLIDCYRHKHPTSHTFSCFHHARCRLLDRIFAPDALLQYVEQCHVDCRTVSNHRPVVMHIRPGVAQTHKGHPFPRHRIHFDKHDVLLQEFQGWATSQLVAAPMGDDIIEWWPSFKVALAGMIRVLNTKARTLQEAPGAEEVYVADRELVAAIQALELTTGSTAHSLQRVVEAKARYVKALAAHSSPADLRARWQWLHEGERAAAHFKGVLAHANTAVVAVRTPGGGLASTPTSIASVLVAHYARISADPVCEDEAVQHVLAAVRAHATPVDQGVASRAGAPQVSCEEVRAACKHMAPGTAPGPDGMPVNVWRVGRGCLQPLLARLFTAIGNTHSMPHMFTWGAVCPISKSGNATSPANYRPITLLNTDYRVLARVLNARLVGVLADSIGPEQSAFLPKRLIGDNINFLQLLPAALRAQQGMPGLPSSAAVAFIDFAKAYDTISRPFLYAVIEAVGAGAFLPWVKALLSDCRACVVVNGCKSPWAQWEAGVRQGCPLSPSLYLFVAWALSCWLQAQPRLGVVVAGQRRVCMQFADDTEVFIRSLAEADVQPLCLCMAVFKQASGQDMNTDKSTLLHIGTPTTPPSPSVVCGMPVVTMHKALGVHIHNDTDDVPHTTSIWTRLIEGVEHSFTKLARLHMSAMGRGLAASTFAVSRFLFHGEFMGLPPPPLLQRITSASQKLVDRGVPPDSSTRSPMPGVPGLLLSGAPSQGGFGLLPWKQHMLARHAVWACKLLGFLACDGLPLQPMQVRRRRELHAAMQAATPSRQRHLRNQLERLQHPPHRAAWMSLTPLILLTASPHLHPAFHLLALARAKPGVSGNLPEAGLPGLLRRIVAALRGLGCPTDLTPELPLPVGPACSHIPVWGNPLLAMEDAQQPPAPFPQQAGAQALQWVAEWATTGFQELAAIPSLTNLSSLLHLCRVTQPAGRGGRVGSREWQRAVWGEEQVARSIAVAVRANPARCATGLFAMWARLPTGWQQEVARQAPLPAPADPQALQRVAVAMVMDRLGWLPKGPPTGRAPAPSPIPILEGATVKCLTRVLMEPVTMLRAEANARFVKDALAGMWSPPPTPTSAPHLPLPSSPPATQAQGEAWLASRVPTLWKLPWLNSSKEVMWRLAVNGVPRDFWSQVQDFVALHTIPHNWPAGNSIPHNHPFTCTHGDGQARQLRTHLPDIGAIEDMLPVDLD